MRYIIPEPKAITAHISMLGATLLFGINYWVAKGLMPLFLQPLQIIFLRIAGALLLFWTIGMILPETKRISIHHNDYLRVALAAFLGITLNQILFFVGLNNTTPIDTAIINSMNPLIVLVFSAMLLKHSIRPFKIFGIFAGAIGAILLVYYGSTAAVGEGSRTGNLLILANTTCWSLYLVVAKPLMSKYHPFVIMRWVFLFGFFFALPFTLKPFLSINISGFTIATWGAVFYIIIGTTFFAYLFISFSLRRLSPPVVAVYTYIQPVIVAGIGIGLFEEQLSFVKILAAILVFTGIYLVSRDT